MKYIAGNYDVRFVEFVLHVPTCKLLNNVYSVDTATHVYEVHRQLGFTSCLLPLQAKEIREVIRDNKLVGFLIDPVEDNLDESVETVEMLSTAL